MVLETYTESPGEYDADLKRKKNCELAEWNSQLYY